MARRIDHRARSRWDARKVYTTLVDPAFLDARLARLGGTHARLVEHRVESDGRATVKLRHGVAGGSLPPAVRTLLGGDLMIDRVETWRPDPNGGYSGTVSVTIPAMPGELGGTHRLTDSGTGSDLVVDGSVGIPIPFVGAKIEETVVDQITKLLDAEHAFAEEWLDQHHT
jgi:Protein of unknown function (DUF2505)